MFIAALMQGQTFGAAYEAAQAQVADFDLGGLLGTLIGGKAIAGIVEGEDE